MNAHVQDKKTERKRKIKLSGIDALSGNQIFNQVVVEKCLWNARVQSFLDSERLGRGEELVGITPHLWCDKPCCYFPVSSCRGKIKQNKNQDKNVKISDFFSFWSLYDLLFCPPSDLPNYFFIPAVVEGLVHWVMFCNVTSSTLFLNQFTKKDSPNMYVKIIIKKKQIPKLTFISWGINFVPPIMGFLQINLGWPLA